MRFLIIVQALQWAFSAWYKHSLAWTCLWFIFLFGMGAYLCTSFVIGIMSPLAALFVLVVGCLLPSYVYAAFIQAGLQQYNHPKQIIEKHFFSYFSVGAALDIFITRLFFILMVLGMRLLMVPLAFYGVGFVCVYCAYMALYFYPYAAIDASRCGTLKLSVLYAYHQKWYCVGMTLLWFIALFLTVVTIGAAGFFVFPVLTLADVFVYEKCKINVL
jgi:hypothetical protein